MNLSLMPMVGAIALPAAPAPLHSLAREHILPGRASPWAPALMIREQIPATGDRSRPVLYIHGATFPSASSMMARLGGRSWADDLNQAGFDVFALDFAGYGGSERYPAMMVGSSSGDPVGRAPVAAGQIARAVREIRRETGARRISIIAHSWGTMPAALFTILNPNAVDRLVLFAPILRREGRNVPLHEAWSLVTIAAQHQRFTKDVPAGHAPVLAEDDFPAWADAYLRSDPDSLSRSPPAVKVPEGPDADVRDAWSGRLAYDPARLTRPVLLVRGQWDSSSTARDAHWFMGRLCRSVESSLVTIPEATHLMHLESGRSALYDAVNSFLSGRPAGSDGKCQTRIP